MIVSALLVRGELKPLFVYGYLREGLPLALSIACHTRYQKSDRGIPPSSLIQLSLPYRAEAQDNAETGKVFDEFYKIAC